MKQVHVHSSRSYDVLIGRGLLQEAGQRIAPLLKGRRVMIVTDSHVAPLYLDALRASLEAAGFTADDFVFPAGEESKCGQTYLSLLSALAQKQLTRADGIVALGGGVTGDLAGFAASTYLRGISYIQMPTTLLAAVDSSVGGKTAIDLPEGKNLCGAFYQPSLVLCDPDTLKTLPEDVFSDGCAEVIKYGLIGSEQLLRMLLEKDVHDQLEEVIALCVSMKRDIVEKDEFDTGERQLLNLGHTFAHGVEKLSGYQVSHGRAVAVGMAVILRAAVEMNVCERHVLNTLLQLLQQYQLPASMPYAAEDMYRMALSDKKRSADHITLVVPTALGKSELRKMPVKDVLLWAQKGTKA